MDLPILQALANRYRFRSLRGAVPEEMLSIDTRVFLQWFEVYFAAYPDRDDVTVPELKSLIKLRAAGQNPEQVQIALHLCDQLGQPVDETVMRGILGQLAQLDLAGRGAALITRFNNGEEIDLAYELNKLSGTTVRQVAQSRPEDYETTPIDQILQEVADNRGISWRSIRLLQEHVMALQGGASIAIAARPDKGKTSLIAKTLSDFAPQCAEFFGDDRPIYWFNNEGSSKRIIPRVYQAVLNMDLFEITKLSNAGELQSRYVEALRNRPDTIRVKDMHGASLAYAEQVIDATRPCVVVFDMLANFRMPGVGGGNKADAVEQAWQEVRELAVKYDFIALSTVQISAEGDNQLYPPYSALKDSKTGIQGATDVIVMMGSLNNPALANTRGISTPKNKFNIPGKPSYCQGEVTFDAARVGFCDAGSTPAK